MNNLTNLTDALKEPFPSSAISWRAKTIKNDGTSALALAYIDARDVMNRLDDVCGAANWKDEYFETPSGRIICKLSINLPTGVPESPYYEWVHKSDGAGDTDVEGEKGALSDAFKRAAVKWGVGRHLYDLPAQWIKCEATQVNGKWVFRKWLETPKTTPDSLFEKASLRKTWENGVIKLIEESVNQNELNQVYSDNKIQLSQMKNGHEYDALSYEAIMQRFSRQKTRLLEDEQSIAAIKEQLRERE